VLKLAEAAPPVDRLPPEAPARSAIQKQPPERSLRLEACHQDRGVSLPEIRLEVMTNSPRIAHAAGDDDRVVSVELVDRLALIDGFREAHILRGQSSFQDIPVVYLFGVFPENSACSGCER